MHLIPATPTFGGGSPSRFTVGGGADAARSERLRGQIVAAAAVVVFAAALSVLLRGPLRNEWLKTPFRGQEFMTVNAALCFLLAAVALWLLRGGSRHGWRLRVVRICAAALVLQDVHFLAEDLLGRDFGLVAFYRQHLPGPLAEWLSVRPALCTSLSLSLLGLGLLLIGRRLPGRLRHWHYSEILSLPALFAGFLGVVGYVMGANALLKIFPALTPMSLYSSLCIFALSTGVLFADADHHLARILLSPEPGGVVARRVLPSAAATLFLLGWLGIVLSRSEPFDLYTASAVLVVCGTFVLAGVVMWTASLLNRDAAERRSALQSVAYLSSIVEWSNDAIIGKTLEGTIASWNHGAEKLYGYTAAEVVGRSADILLPPGLSVELDENLQRLARGERVEQYETVRQCKDGSVLDVAVTMSPIRDAAGNVIGASSIARDITEANRAAESVRRAKQEWEQTFNSVPDLIAVLDKQHRILRVNQALAQRLGTTMEACVGMSCYGCMHGTCEPPEDCPHTLTLRDGQQHIVELREQLLDGDFVVSTTPFLDENGELAGSVHVSRDVSELKKAHQALVRSEKLATTGQLAASIAHEIHNPLDIVGNLLFLVQQGTKEEETRKFAAMAAQELSRVTQITQQMLTFQREANAPVPVSVPEVLENVLALYQRKIEAAGIRIEQQVDAEAWMLALPGQTRQIFANLIGNAIEAMKRSDGRISLRAYHGRDRKSGQAGLRFLIADNGQGIPSELQKKIFDPFFTTKGEKGTGLGLWITQGIVEKSGGTLRVRSTTREGRSGTCFSLFFPTADRPVAVRPLATTPELPFPNYELPFPKN